MKRVPVAIFNELAPARRLQQRLAQAGFVSFLRDESKLERLWSMSDPLAALPAEVRAADYLAVRPAIQRWDATDGVLREAMRCPDCGSARVESPQHTRKFLTPAVEALPLAVHWLPLEFSCLDCHFTWPLRPRVEPERDWLGGPRQSRLWRPEASRRAPPRLPAETAAHV